LAALVEQVGCGEVQPRYGGWWPFETSQHDDLWHMRMDARIAEAIRSLRDK
jgi:hypothetical protein